MSAIVEQGDGGPISLAKMEKRLGIKSDGSGRVLLRLLLAKEKSTGQKILMRGLGQRRVRYRVSMSAIRRYARELLPSKVDELRRNMTAYLDDIDSVIRDKTAKYVAEAVDPQIEQLWERDENLALEIDRLAQKVAEMAKRSTATPSE